MYSRESEEGPRRFGVSGKLWHGVLVFIDRETESLWTQVDGRAIQGELVEESREYVPSVFTTFAEWADAHPATLVLEKPAGARERKESHYADYFADPERLYMDHLSEGLGELDPKVVVFGARIDGEAVAVPEPRLERDGALTTTLAGVEVRFERDAGTGAVRVTRTADGSAVRSDRAYWYAWKRSHPESAVVMD